MTCSMWSPDKEICLYSVRQEPEEPPLAFCERLCGVAKKWTNLDPEDEANQKMFNVLFIGQLSQDVRKKLKKLGGAEEMSFFQITEIAYMMYSNRRGKGTRQESNCRLLF